MEILLFLKLLLNYFKMKSGVLISFKRKDKSEKLLNQCMLVRNFKKRHLHGILKCMFFLGLKI